MRSHHCPDKPEHSLPKRLGWVRGTPTQMQGIPGCARHSAQATFALRPTVSTFRANLFLTTLTRLGHSLQRHTATQSLEELVIAQPPPYEPGRVEAAEFFACTSILGRPIIDTATRRTVKVGLTLAQTPTIQGTSDADIAAWVPTSLSMPERPTSILRRACLIGKGYEEHAPEDVVISLDCPEDLFMAETFLASLHESLCASGLAPGRLELGLGESVLLDPSSETVSRLDTLSQWGVKLAVVDFGAKLAPFSCLERSDLESVVLAPALVRAVSRSLKNPQYPLALIRAVVEAASFLDIEVVASGVETFDEFKLLQSLGCVHQQGDFFGPLVDAEHQSAWKDLSLSKCNKGPPGFALN